MDLHPTTLMLTSREIKVLHLEPTDVCQARCPLCARETDRDFDATRHHHITWDQIVSAVGIDMISNLDKMFMCGNYGDPAAGHYTLDIYRRFREQNSNIVLGMNTNGALRTTSWWRELAKIMQQPRDYVVFSIDGLEDTNHLYRINVDWQRLMQNAQAYISAGGSAHWDMLVYRHNEHQVDACERLARDMGFRWFRAKVSRRPLVKDLQYPVAWKAQSVRHGAISCYALNENSLYLDAQGNVGPCCWLGSRQKDFITDFSLIQESWNTATPNPICYATCAKIDQGTSFTNQWQIEKELS